MWKRICAYVLGIPLVFLGALYTYNWYSLRPLRLEARELLADVAAREAALDSLGDIELNPTNLPLSKLEESLYQPGLAIAGAHNTTRMGWACAGKDCEIWAFFAQPLETKLEPGTMPIALLVRDTVLRRQHHHQLSIGGVRLGESVSQMKEYCMKRGYGREEGFHRMTWDKDWSLTWADESGKVSLLMFVNDNSIKNAQTGVTPHSKAVSP
jgi:hypothetical protein